MEEEKQSRMEAVLDKDKTNKANYTCSNFHFQTPVNIFFGKDAVSHLPEQIPVGSDVLLVYGGASAKFNGAYEALTAIMDSSGIRWHELPGCIGPYYRYVEEGISLCHEHNISCVIGVGGCSCMDIAKMIAFGAKHDDIWEYLTFDKPVTGHEERLIIGCVPTYPSGGSEADASAEIDDTETGRHGSLYGFFADFSLLNPEFTFTLDKVQSAYAGIVTFIQASVPFLGGSFPLTDSFGLSIMNSVRNSIAAVQKNPHDYDARAAQMWASAMTTSKLLYCGKQLSWCFSLYNDVEVIRLCMPLHYRQAFTVLFPEWLRAIAKYHQTDVERYLTAVFPELAGEKDLIQVGCDRLRTYFKSIGLPVCYSEYGDTPDESRLREAAEKLASDSAFTVDELVDIYKSCMSQA
ncbi:iron-containing alcohol dehydrogenase [Barnesiella sp. WM24]|nr:iron-containing alcohol dehydrogenase [Barnesiella sp. WM24]